MAELNYKEKLDKQFELFNWITEYLSVNQLGFDGFNPVFKKIGEFFSLKNISFIRNFDVNFWEVSVEWSQTPEFSKLYINGNWEPFLSLYNFLLSGNYISDNDSEQSAEFLKFKDKLKCNKLALIPIIDKGKIVHIFALADIEKKFFYDFEIQFLTQILTLLSNSFIANEKNSFLQNEYYRLNDEVAHLANQINLIPAFFIQKSVNLKFESVNEYLTSLFEVSRFQLIGKRDKDIFDEHFAEISEKIDIEVLQNLKQDFRVHEIKIKNNTHFFAYHRIPYRSEITNSLKLLILAFDITTYVVQKIKSEEGSKIKSEFLANMSHEIRTPLNSIMGFTDLLLQENLSNDQFETALNIKQSSQSLITLINDILDLNKIEAGKLEINLNSFRLIDLLREIKTMFEPRIYEKEIYLKLQLDESIPEYIYSDQLRIRQILINLVGNSIKFTKKGGIIVEVKRIDDLSDKEILRIDISVTDTGIGIPEDKLEKIFEAFEQAEKDTTVKFGGTGLGLTITKKLVELLGSQIKVSSEENRGTKFWFTLLITQPDEIQFQSIVQNFEYQDLSTVERRLKVLVVEDDLNIIKFYERFFKVNYYDFKIVTKGVDAINQTISYQPDVILLDIMLPEKNGWEILKELKLNPRTKSIPTIVCTLLKEENKAINLGALEYLEKPINVSKLHDILNNITDKVSSKDKIVLIDDDLNTLNKYSEIFKKLDYKIETFSRADIALKSILKKSPPSLIILDLMMPHMDGFQFMDELRKHENYITIPIIVSTSKKLTREDLKKIYEKCNSVVLKSDFNEDLFVNQLNKLFKKIDIKPIRIQPLISTIGSDETDQLSKLKVLLAEDNNLNQKLFASILQKLKISFDIVNDGLDCINKLYEKKYDLILMDIQMPVMDGIRATTEIRKGNIQKDIPIIALTAHAMKGDKERFEAIGCNSYITKPVDQQKLITEILKVIKKTEKDYDAISPYFRGFSQEEITRFRTEYLDEIGKEINKLDEKMTSRNFEALKFFGHNIKGNGVAYGFPAISKIGAKIEEAAKDSNYPDLVTLFNELKSIMTELKP